MKNLTLNEENLLFLKLVKLIVKEFKKLEKAVEPIILFSECKIFSNENIFGKGKYFQVFNCIMKIVLENVFRCLVAF